MQVSSFHITELSRI